MIGSFDDPVGPKRAIRLSRKDWLSRSSGAVLRSFRAFDVLRDPAPPASWPRWGFGGDGKGCRKPKEISMSKPVKRRSASLSKDKKKAHRKSRAQAPAPKTMKYKRERGAPVGQVRPQTSRSESKQARIIAMLRAPSGAT